MLDVYTRVRADFNASIYYRLYLPLTTMHKLKLPVRPMFDQETIYMNPIHRYTTMAGADICAFYQSVGLELQQFMEQSRAATPATDESGVLRYPPTFIFDTDDDIFNVDPMNPSFQTLGYKDHTGKDLPAGEKVWIRSPETNEPLLLWADGENIDYAKNKSCLDNWRKTLEMSELVTCSTPAVQEYVKRESPLTRTFHSPNCIDLAAYYKVELAEHPNEVRLLWQGSTTHWWDMWAMREPLNRVLRKYPHARLVLWSGMTHEWVMKYLPREQVEWLDWVPYSEYKARLNTINHDINLAPLREITFNRCRSGIKWYESAACWKPVPTLAEASTPYNEIEDGVTGLLYRTPEEFETKLSGLIEDATLRATIAGNAKDWIKTHRDPSRHALALYAEYEAVRAARKEWPVPPRAVRRRTERALPAPKRALVQAARKAKRLKAVRKAG